MFNKGKLLKIAALTIALTLLVAIPVFAQSETEPLADPDPVQMDEQSKFFGSKIVQLIADFFTNLINPPQEDPPADVLPADEPPASVEQR